MHLAVHTCILYVTERSLLMCELVCALAQALRRRCTCAEIRFAFRASLLRTVATERLYASWALAPHTRTYTRRHCKCECAKVRCVCRCVCSQFRRVCSGSICKRFIFELHCASGNVGTRPEQLLMTHTSNSRYCVGVCECARLVFL